jgi:hypothetical protein
MMIDGTRLSYYTGICWDSKIASIMLILTILADAIHQSVDAVMFDTRPTEKISRQATSNGSIQTVIIGTRKGSVTAMASFRGSRWSE